MRRRATPTLRRRHERLVPRPALQRRRDRGVSRRPTATRRAASSRPRWPIEIAALLADGESRRPGAGPDGIRAARARRPLDHRRRALAEDAVGDEPQDQVPRVVPAVRAGGAARARRTSGSSSTATARTCCWSPTCSRRGGCRRRTDAQTLWGIDKLNVPRSTVPAVTHVDYSARVQTVRRETNPLYYDIIEAFYRRTGCPVIVNTSFNVRGEPIVCTPEDAYPLLHAHRHGRARARELHPAERAIRRRSTEDESWRKEFVLD